TFKPGWVGLNLAPNPLCSINNPSGIVEFINNDLKLKILFPVIGLYAVLFVRKLSKDRSTSVFRELFS
ncbi:433_t:CDS:1, partial [Entrophospora sp. SA101]